MIKLGPKLGLIDLPDERRIHVRPIPRSGGIGIFLVMVASFLALSEAGVAFTGLLGGRWLMHFLAASSLLFIIGVIDDRRGVSAYVKLAVQTLAATLMFFHNPQGIGLLMGVKIPMLLDLCIHVGWTVALINAFNLIDGMDGLCAGLGSIALFILAALTMAKGYTENAFVIVVMAIALVGFLRFNFHPAKIFLGDTGSMLVGFFIATVGTATVGRNAVVAGLLLPLLVGGVPLFDVGLAVWRRGARRLADSKPGQQATKIFGPDRDHLHHRLLRWGFDQRQATLLIYGFAGVTSVLALVPILAGANYFVVSAVCMIVICLVGLRYLAPMEFIASGRGFRALVRRPRSCRQTMVTYFIYDLLAIGTSAFLAKYLLVRAMVRQVDWAEMVLPVVLFTVMTMACLCFARAHVRRWARASGHDFAECIVWMICGAGISFTVSTATHQDFSFRESVFHISALMLAGAFFVAPRSIGSWLQEGVIDTMHRKRRLSTKSSSKTTLIYGAGDLGELFIRHLKLSQPESWRDHHFVGFIDDNDKLTGRRMQGFPILGTSSSILPLIKEYGANAILITSSVIGEERLDELIKATESFGVEISVWNPQMGEVIVKQGVPRLQMTAQESQRVVPLEGMIGAVES